MAVIYSCAPSPPPTYSQEEIVKVYRAAYEEGRKQGIRNTIDAASTLASGFTDLKNLIEGIYDNTPKPIIMNEPYSFELKLIDEILKRGEHNEEDYDGKE